MFENIVNGIADSITIKVMEKVNARLEEFKTQLPTGSGSTEFTDAQKQEIKELAGEVVDNLDLDSVDGFDYAVKKAVQNFEFSIDVR